MDDTEGSRKNYISDSIKQEPLWQDRTVRFDVPLHELNLRKGEKTIEIVNHVEDTKGNSGDIGGLILTNLRCIWRSNLKPRINLSVGIGCVMSITNKALHSRVRGKYNALHMMSRCNGTRYEFIFALLDENNQPDQAALTSIALLLGKICKAYSGTKLYRDLKLRGALFTNPGKKLKTLPGEQIYDIIDGVWNLSSDQGNLGTMHITSVRIVWHANLNELFNISLPYIQIKSLRIRPSKFGSALVIESAECAGDYVLGFRIDPPSKLTRVRDQLLNLYNVHALNPEIGVEYALEMIDHTASNLEAAAFNNATPLSDQSEFVDEDSDINRSDSLALYMAQEDLGRKESKIVYNEQLGLAIEKLTDGFTLDSLWNVVQTE